MEKIEYDQFSVTILPPATTYHPVDGRKYTLVMSTKDSNYHLAIGFKYEMELLNEETEKILTAEWQPRLGEYILTGRIDFGSKRNGEIVWNNSHKIQGNLTEAISLMVKADKDLYAHVPWLLDAPIYIEIDSNTHKYKTIQYYGTPRQHLI
ncbi:MAG TPA: hypothetical protein DEO65_06835 [Bacillus bacterium]|uniref:Staygreen protein domain-containing protein n=1 Tax=Siminovitchia fordii TaxID=254759 RepID=A0ABQ4K635_9BACI|nr:staygreen family protein [Siminovitchia fordii]GIN21202.1 hypothetical protein J1TS3_23360 [Siminovitchia fordii]HBZ09581.1 hypothetical protein [Bacillus sp. (in: firmicutes)]